MLCHELLGSMQSQMEAKLAQMGLKSPGLKPSVPASPSTRTFGSGMSANRQSLAVESSSFLSPESANTNNRERDGSSANDAAATLVQQRNKLKANAAHRISAPPLASTGDAARTWAVGASALGQVVERSGDSPTQEITIPAPNTTSNTGSTGSRPKSTDFSGLANALRSPRLSTTGEGAEEA